ncbi:hypothetical protein C0992_001036 [Termitomyces sp. T32_za158]|nr:hypothetical protein C0992_001036 [Termitomyces sp. T32_za158]
MSGLPSPRVRTKKADFAQFFRGHPPRQSSQNEPILSPHLKVPEDSDSGTTKKSMLPFLCRPRKKSTPSVKSGILPSVGRGYESEAAELATLTAKATKDRRLSHPTPSPEPTIKKSALPAAKVIPQTNVSSSSLSSKFVAHFSNSKLRKVSSSHSAKAVSSNSNGNATNKLTLHADNRGTSIDSTRTATSTIPAPTPGNAVITITSAPDDLEAYSNIFTLSKAKKTTISRRQTSTPASEYRDNYNKTEPSNPSSPSSICRSDSSAPTSPVSPVPSSSRNETKEWDSRKQTEGNKSSRLYKRTPGQKRGEDPTREDSVDENVLYLRTGDLTPTIDVTPPPLPTKAASPTPRHRLRISSAIKDTRTSDPPSIPLPDPPLMKNSPPASPTSPPSSPRLATMPRAPILRRPRANTTGSVPLSPVSVAMSPTPWSLRQSPKFPGENYAVKKSLNNEISDLDGMTVEQLKEALAQRNQQYAELTTHLLEVTKSHAVEKAVLEKKIAALVTEVARKDKEIQGFTWMLNNRGTQPVTDDDVDYTRIPGPRVQRSHSTASSKLSSRRMQQGDDSGAESPSGAESVPGSGGSVRLKSGLRPLTLGESGSYRSSISSKASSRGPTFDTGLLDQRTSVYSLSSTVATSSSSSFLPPSPSMTHSSLSAIPEISVVTASRVALPRISTSRMVDSASEWETDPGKKSYDMVRPSKSVSGSSFSSSSAATSAYAANLKRGRPPSIAQVLQKSGPMDGVEKLPPSPTVAQAR